jgi:hypothetical protein
MNGLTAFVKPDILFEGRAKGYEGVVEGTKSIPNSSTVKSIGK